MTEKPRVGWIGLGRMGVPICRHLREAGYPVTAYVRNDAGREKAAGLGLPSVGRLAELAASADVVISSITDDAALLDIVEGAAGLGAHMTAGRFVIDTSTVSPGASARAAEVLDVRGVGLLRCPVSGSTATAEARQLTVLASGPRDRYEAALPLLATFSRAQFYLGEGEEARYLKLALNAMVGATAALAGEALALGRKGGLDAAAMLEVINASAVASPLIGYKTKMLIDGDFAPAFTVAGMMKDFDIALAVGRAVHCPLPLTALVRQLYEAAYAGGRGGDDFFVLCDEFARIAGLGAPESG